MSYCSSKSERSYTGLNGEVNAVSTGNRRLPYATGNEHDSYSNCGVLTSGELSKNWTTMLLGQDLQKGMRLKLDVLEDTCQQQCRFTKL